MTTKQEKTKPQTPKPADKQGQPTAVIKKPSNVLAWFTILLVFIASGSGYFAYIQLQQQSMNQSGLSLKNHQNALNQVASLLKTNQSLSANLTTLTEQFNRAQLISNDKVARIEKQVSKNKRQWLIAEAQYLVNLANIRLQLVGDVETAIIALQSADTRLKQNGDPLTFKIRDQLAKEISRLKNAPQPDLVGISAQLIALESLVGHMHVHTPHAGKAQAAHIGSSPSMPQSVQETIDNAWENFSKLIVIRRHDKPLAATMTPEQVELIKQNLALKLEAARLALINQDQALYLACINITSQWITDYFDPTDKTVALVTSELAQLKGLTIKASYPSIALSLKMLNELPILAIEEQQTVSSKAIAKEQESKPLANPSTLQQPATELP